MLVLTRKVGEAIAIGDDIKVVIMQIRGKQVRVGIKAGEDTVVHREEVFQKIRGENEIASQVSVSSVEQAVVAFAGRSSTTLKSPLRRYARPGKKN